MKSSSISYQPIVLKEQGDKHRTFGIGDSYNDLSMIEMCDVGATFHFSDLSIKEKVQKSYSYVYEFIDDILGGYYELER